MNGLVLSLISSFALASAVAPTPYTGTWKGTGMAGDRLGWRSDCSRVEFAIKQAPKKIVFSSGGYACGTVTASWMPLALEVKAKDLMFDGKKIGAITPYEMSFSLTGSDGAKKTYRFAIEAGPGQGGPDALDYTEQWHSPDGQYLLFQLDAKLKK